MTRIKPNEIAQAQWFAQEPVDCTSFCLDVMHDRAQRMESLRLGKTIRLELEKALDRVLGEISR